MNTITELAFKINSEDLRMVCATVAFIAMCWVVTKIFVILQKDKSSNE
jgi:hypothetical protein